MPCYNAAQHLPEALDSLLGQTLLQFEIVAVDDGSTDGTVDVLRSYAARDSRLKIILQEHAGIVVALNAGLAACRAPLVARMDADDVCRPQRLERQAAFLAAHENTALIASRVAGYPPGELRHGLQAYLEWQNSLCSDADIRRELFVESPFTHPSIMVRRSWLEQVGGYQENGWAEDYDLWLRLYLAGASFAKLEELLLDWRDSPDRLTRSDERYSLENFIRLKAFYLLRGPICGADAVFMWGAGALGRRLGRRLLQLGAPLVAFFDIDSRKIGSTRHGLPVLPPEAFLDWWGRWQQPALLAGVGAHGARPILRLRMQGFGLVEGQDWWFAG